MLKTEEIIFDRDEKGELIPREVKLVIDETDEEQLKYKDETVFITPIPRGKMKRMVSEMLKSDDDDADLDAKIVSEHCINPKMSFEEAKFIKPMFMSMIVDTIFVLSGVDNKKKTRKENLQDAEDDFAKN